MDLSPINSITIGVSLIVGTLIGIILRKKIAESGHKDIEKQGSKLLEDAISAADRVRQETLLKVKDEVLVLKQDAESEIRSRNKDLKKEERKFSQKLDQIDTKIDILDKREIESLQKEKYFVKQEAKLANKREELQSIINEQQIKLEKVAGIPKEEAKKQLMESIESEARMEAAKEVVRIENEMKIKADKKAKKILALAMARYAGDYVAERTVSIVQLPSDEMKGRIIGREGRNIRAIEAATGIDIIIDDTPEAVILSGFNPVRREVARLAMERLTTDGRIHPARIEEVVNKVAKELDISIKETGEQATFDVGVHGLHVELIQLIGRLKYRTSYGQSVLLHSLEVAFLCGIMAAELGLDVKQAKRAGLLHDIGKAVDHEVDGSHASIGQNLAKKYGETPEIVHAIAAHHEEVEPNCILDILVQSADALSGARPGARKEMLESYVKRLEDLEAIAEGFDGVERAYAIQAGRELRVVVDSGRINDATASLLAKDVTKKIEEGLTYPGQIKVTVIRETRAVFYAK